MAATGEPLLVLNYGALESACFKPRNLWHYEREEDAVILAVSLLFGIARAHAFQQGNKRTAFKAFVVFLAFAGYDLGCEDSPLLAELIVSVIRHTTSERAFEAAIRPFVVIF